ncbi:MAG: glycosyltransferase family 4 protein [Ilumatobacteraceae bacterium]|jgi:phosphatidyl-myo-inositol alpha-mannosyltransferase|nr:glycosyltransferase family 4 protein [Ilumatobacteraceae bacterium]
MSVPSDSLRSETVSRLRIGLLCPYSLTTPGGVQGQVMGLARALRKMGHEVRVLGPCDGAPPDTFVTPIGESLPTVANGSIAPLAPDPSAALRTIRVLRDEQFDVLHLHEPLTPGATITALVMRTAPIVATFHAAGESLSYKYLSAPLKGFASAIDHRVAVSKDAVQLAQRYLGGDYQILPNGVELDRFLSTSRIATSSDRQSVFFCGRHEPRKGLEVLLRAHATLPDNVDIWIASEGPETERLKREWAGDSRLIWLGRISDAEKAQRLSQADVFCAPSLGGESFGVVLIEAMAASTPIVASALDGYMNVATHEVDALLVEPNDPQALESALRRILLDQDLAQRLVSNGQKRASGFSMVQLAHTYVDIYRRIIAESRHRPTRRQRLRRFLARDGSSSD